MPCWPGYGRALLPGEQFHHMQVDNEVLAVLSRATVDGSRLTLVGQLDRALYTRTDKVLQAAGGKWDRKAKAHVFTGDAGERIEQIIATGDVVVPRDDFEYFPTPPEIAARVIAAAQIGDGMMVLEPSAGRGALAAPAAASGAVVDCVELMQANHEHLLTLPGLRTVERRDFLAVPQMPLYDRVIMNPPFGRQADIKHVLHALGFVKAGGLLVAVMSAGVSFRENRLTTDFRQLVEDRGGSIEPLPDGAFKASGTMVSTAIVTIPN